jgi:hypothetical protein
LIVKQIEQYYLIQLYHIAVQIQQTIQGELI